MTDDPRMNEAPSKDDDELQNEGHVQPVSSAEHAGMPGDGAGRREEPGRTGAYPASGPLPDEEMPAQGMASFGQGDRGSRGNDDAGTSQLDLEPGAAQTDMERGQER